MNLKSPLAAVLVALMTTATAWAQTDDGATATATGAVSATHAKDLRAIMEALHTFEYITAAQPSTASLPAFIRDYDAAFRRQITREYLYRYLQSAFAHFLDPKRAADLAQLMDTPVFRKREARAMVAANNVSFGTSYFTQAETAELRRIDSHPAIVELRTIQPKLQAEVQKVLMNWAIQYGGQMSEKAMHVLRKVNEDLASAREAGQARTITVGRVGLPSLDKIVSIVSSSLIKISNASLQFDRELKDLGFADVLKPEYLASKASLAHSRNVVDRAETALETLLKDVNGAVKEREDGLRSVEIPFTDEYLKSINRSVGNMYIFFVDFGEASRRVLDQHRRALAFIEERQEKPQFKDGRLVFASDAELAMAREIFSNVDMAVAELRRVVGEQAKREKALMDKGAGAVSVPIPDAG